MLALLDTTLFVTLQQLHDISLLGLQHLQNAYEPMLNFSRWSTTIFHIPHLCSQQQAMNNEQTTISKQTTTSTLETASVQQREETHNNNNNNNNNNIHSPAAEVEEEAALS